MIRALFILLAVVCLTSVMAQVHWAQRVGAWSNDAFNDVAVDATGLVYAVGEFGGSIPVSTTTISSNGSLDAMVAKYDAAGELLWVRTFGGAGLDRASGVVVGPGGELVVVGQFMGTVNVDGNTLQAQGSTPDIFVMRLDPANGEVLWVRQGGAPDGVDQVNDVSVGPGGVVALTGEFRGTAVFDAGTLTSTPEPLTGLPSVDIFVAAYDANGTGLWLQHGAADLADRGMAIAHDPAGNVYVTGQFSDTLTFDQTHNNQMFSAVFIARFGPGGEEQWLRIFGGGTYNQVFDMRYVEAGHLLLTGDLQGTVIYQDAVPDLFTAPAPYSSFVLRVGLNGELMAQTMWGSDHPLTTRALSVRGNDLAVLGRFDCQLTGFAAVYGPSSFTATGEHDLYVVRFQLSDLDFKEAQQFGGQGTKEAGGIGHLPDGDLVFSGSYEHQLVFPCNYGFEVSHPTALQAPNVPWEYCEDVSYGIYKGLAGSSLLDGFIARGYVDGREPYDIYDREGEVCDRSVRPPVLRSGGVGILGPDSLSHCGPVALIAETFTAYWPSVAGYHTGPEYSINWSTGDSDLIDTVTTTGWVWVDVSLGANCLMWRDSLHVIIHSIPTRPLVNDDVVVNTSAFNPADIQVCDPAQPWLWATGIAAGNTVQWFSSTQTVQGDSIQANATGSYNVLVTTPAGCTSWNNVYVGIIPGGPLDDFDVEFTSSFPQDADNNDSLALCIGDQFLMRVDLAYYLNGTAADLPDWVNQLRRCGTQGWSILADDPWFSCNRTAQATGWYHFEAELLLTNAPCGSDSLFFTVSDSIHVTALPLPAVTMTLTGPNYLCPGDTILAVGACVGCLQIVWGGPGIVATSGDTAWVAGPGNVVFSGQATSPEGCFTMANSVLTVSWNPNPLLGVWPVDGIICPDSSAIIFTEAAGSDFQWYGPLGPLSVNNDTLVTTQPGLYYLEMVDTLGCPVTSAPMQVTDYATPYLNVLPDNVLCGPDETTTLQVVTTSASTLSWWAPFSGSAVQQVVTEPGVYMCSVNACGITHVLSAEVFGNTANADVVEEGPFILCPDETIQLSAPPGNAITYWLPGPVYGGTLSVSTADTYTLVAVDAFGCEAESEVVVEELSWTSPLLVQGSEVCAGSSATLTATGSGTITWYADAALTQAVHSGSIWTLPAVAEGAVYQVTQTEGPCISEPATVVLTVLPVPTDAQLAAPDEVCAGGELDLELTGSGALSGTWSTPVGTYSGPALSFSSATSEHDGTYVVVPFIGPCAGDTLMHQVVVLVPQAPDLGNDTSFCTGGWTTLEVPTGFTGPVWTTGSTSTSIIVDQPGTYGLWVMDAQGCPVYDEVVLDMVHCDPLLPNTITPNGDGQNDGWSIDPGTVRSAQLSVFNRFGALVWEGDLTNKVFTGIHGTTGEPLADGAYFYVIRLFGTDGSSKDHTGYLQLLR